MNSHDIQPKYFGAFNQQANQDHCLDQQEEELSKKQKASKTGLKCKKSCWKYFNNWKRIHPNNTTTNSIQSSHDFQKSDSLMRFPVTTSTIFSSPGEIEFLRRNHKNNQVKCQSIITLIYHLQLSPLQHVMKFIKIQKISIYHNLRKKL